MATKPITLFDMFTATPQLSEEEQRTTIKEAHRAASKHFKEVWWWAWKIEEKRRHGASVISTCSRDEYNALLRAAKRAVKIAAETPAMTKSQYAAKRSLIGRAWLKAEGHDFDVMREGLARDAARLGLEA